LLCQIETQLSTELVSLTAEYDLVLRSATNGLRDFRTPLRLLSRLKATHADTSSDDLYRDLLASRAVSPQVVEILMILAFVPVLHGTVRRIAKNNSHLARADITQQTLSVFLQVLHSEQIERRQSHFVFAITRSVKRQLFEWAGREGTNHGPAKREELQAVEQLRDHDVMERHAALRHFLYRCVTNGLLADGELDLLVQIKLDGNTGDEIAESCGLTSNAVRQRMKRLLAKLRRIAGNA
jgi:DNA-directed RNA polymerase specialized sigma24 family protein